MTKAQSEALKGWMEQWAERLGLGGWRPTLHLHERPELPPEISDGKVRAGLMTPNHDRRWVEIAVALYARDGTPREIIMHELLHLMLTEMAAATQRLEEQLAPAAYKLFAEQYDDAEETAVHRLTRALLPRRQRRGR